MGTVSSKSPLERRNTVARRSQRRTLHNLKSKVEQLHKDIKKFKGVSEDVTYVAFRNEIDYFKNDLTRRGKDLQPQLRNLYETVYKRICEAEEALQNKLQENREKQDKKESKQKANSETTQSIVDNSEVFSDVTSNAENGETVVDIHAENREAHQLEHSEEKRKTVEIKVVKVLPEQTSPIQSRVVSPAEKRKSILKVGIPVMPEAVLSEFAAQSNRLNRQYHTDDTPAPVTTEDVMAKISNTVESLRKIELEINDFVGKKNGKQYVRIRDALNRYLIELNSLSPADDYAVDQIKICRNYIGSCLSFLDERATETRPESFTSDDEVFENNNILPQMTKVEENFRVQRLLKNTSV